MRASGLLLLVVCGLLWRCTCRLADQPATPLECAVAALAFACLSVGIALFVEGPGLLRPVPVPPRAWLP